VYNELYCYGAINVREPQQDRWSEPADDEAHACAWPQPWAAWVFLVSVSGKRHTLSEAGIAQYIIQPTLD
jgi:hypothetical protein